MLTIPCLAPVCNCVIENADYPEKWINLIKAIAKQILPDKSTSCKIGSITLSSEEQAAYDECIAIDEEKRARNRKRQARFRERAKVYNDLKSKKKQPPLFHIPTVEDIRKEMIRNGYNHFRPEDFVRFYAKSNWTIKNKFGRKSPIKDINDIRATLKRWERNGLEKGAKEENLLTATERAELETQKENECNQIEQRDLSMKEEQAREDAEKMQTVKKEALSEASAPTREQVTQFIRNNNLTVPVEQFMKECDRRGWQYIKNWRGLAISISRDIVTGYEKKQVVKTIRGNIGTDNTDLCKKQATTICDSVFCEGTVKFRTAQPVEPVADMRNKSESERREDLLRRLEEQRQDYEREKRRDGLLARNA